MTRKFPGAPNWAPSPVAALAQLRGAAYLLHLLPENTTDMERLLHAVRASASELRKPNPHVQARLRPTIRVAWATLRPHFVRPLEGEAAALLKESRMANCTCVKRLFAQRAEYAASLGMLFAQKPAAMAVYNDRMAELCDATVAQAAASDAIQAFWMSFLEPVDALEHHRNERALPWGADNVRTACQQLLPCLVCWALWP